MLDRELGPRAEALLYQSVLDESLHFDPFTHADWRRIRDLVTTYADLRLGGTDAGLIALAERHHEQPIATLNHRHFAVARPTHIDAFTLLPDNETPGKLNPSHGRYRQVPSRAQLLETLAGDWRTSGG